MNTTELSAQERATYKSLLATLKADRKAHSQEIREAKREISIKQSLCGSGSMAIEQSRLVSLRQKTRAEHLLYGALRGRTWDQMEPTRRNHTKEVRYFLKVRWPQEQDQYKLNTGKELVNDTVQEILSS